MKQRTFKLKEFAQDISVAVKDAQLSPLKRFVGLEHYDSNEPVITRFTDTSLLSSSVKEFSENDILIARRNVYLRRAGIVFFSGLTSGDSIVLRIYNDCEDRTGIPKDDAIRIIPFILNSNDFWAYANKHADGMNSKRISKDMLYDYEFSLPPIEEQRILADKLWAAYRLKESYKKLLTATQEMVKSQFIEMFGDPMTNSKGWSEHGKINKYAQIILGSTPNSKEASYWDGDIKWITPAEMTEESYYIYDTERHITEEGVNSASLTLLPYRSVLFSTRAPIGKVGLVGSPMYCNQGFKNFICGNQLNPVYLYYSLIYKREYLVSLGTGTTFKELSKKTVEGLELAIPPIYLQEQFEKIYDQADKSEFELRKSIEAIDQVIKSLINN